MNPIEELKQIKSKTKNYICLDIETTGLRPWYGDRITCICAKGSKGKKYSDVNRDEEMLIEMFLKWMLSKPMEEHFLITKNGKNFDIPFILTRLSLKRDLCEAGDLFILKMPHFDLQEITSKRISLQVMAELLGCNPKSGTGENAIKLWKEKRYDELKAYCMQDVNTTIEVFETWKKLHKL